jgi:hypothetical protein
MGVKLNRSLTFGGCKKTVGGSLRPDGTKTNDCKCTFFFVSFVPLWLEIFNHKAQGTQSPTKHNRTDVSLWARGTVS